MKRPLFFHVLILSSIVSFVLLDIMIVQSADLTDPEEILRRVDENQAPETSRSEIIMIIHERGRKYEKEMSGYNEGETRSYAEFSNPPRDRGTKYLKIGDNMWMYLPGVERVIKIAGHMLRQSMMGSDFSYEDMLEARKLLDNYEPVLLRKESLEERDCYVIELTAITHDVTYYRRVIWVDSGQFVILRSEHYAKTGKLLKLLTVQKVERFGERFYPVNITMEDKLRKDTKTQLITKKLELNIPIPEIYFSRQNLERR